MDFLTEHQKILGAILKGPKDRYRLDARIDEFMIRIEAAIEAHNYDYQGIRNYAVRLNDTINELCKYRDLIQTQRKIKDESNRYGSGSVDGENHSAGMGSGKDV